VHLCPSKAVEQEVAISNRRRRTTQQQNGLQPNPARSKGSGPTVVAADAATGHHTSAATLNGIAEQILELPNFVSRQAKPGQVITLYPDVRLESG
jgi:hypothetical protein